MVRPNPMKDGDGAVTPPRGPAPGFLRRRIALVCTGAFALAVAAVALLPWWLGAVLGIVGPARGLTFARYERSGYTRFVLHDVELRVPAARIRAARIELDAPLFALWRRGDVTIGRWSVEAVDRAVPPSPVDTAQGWKPLRKKLQTVATQLGRWVPRATAEAGVVRWPGAELTCASAEWSGQQLTAKQLAWRGLNGDATVAFLGDPIRLTWLAPEGSITLESRAETVSGDLRWWGQRAELSARFGENGWLPQEAKLLADSLEVPGEKLRLGETYATVRGRGEFTWKEKKLAAVATATGEPLPGRAVPPLAVALRGHGGLDTFIVESLDATLPGIALKLSAPVTVDRGGHLRPSEASLTIAADLGKLPWLDATGTANGEARLVSAAGKTPVLDFQLTARDVVTAGWNVASIEATGDFAWPRMRVKAGSLAGVAGEKLRWSGGWDFVTKEIFDGSAEGELRRTTVARWMPAGIGFGALAFEVKAGGPLAQLRHTGTARAEAVTLGPLNPLGLAATWAGVGATAESATLEATAGATKVTAAGSVGADGMRLTKWELSQDGKLRLALTQPTELRWRPNLAAQGLRFAGPEGRIEAEFVGGPVGRVNVAITNCASEWVRELGIVRGPAWRVDSLAAAGTWDRGALTYSLNGKGTVALGGKNSAALAATVRGDETGLRIEELSVIEEGQPVVGAVGKIPLRVNPTAAQLWEFLPDGELALNVTTAPTARFWAQLGELTGLAVQAPEAVARVTGTWARPQGTINVKAARVTADPLRFKQPLPTVEALDLELAADTGEVRLLRLAADIEGQAVRASARMPVAADTWRGFASGRWPGLRTGTEARIELPEGEIAAFARFLPEWLAPRGRLAANISFRNGTLGGNVKLSEGATRPLGSLGALRDLNAEVILAGPTMELKTVTAQSGGQTVTLSGTVGLPDLTTKSTEGSGVVDGLTFAVALKGENLPLVRDMGMLVRADLDLKLQSPGRGPPQIAGTVRLRESLLFSDVRALVPRGVRTKTRRPPYFAVEVPPFDTWTLAVAVQGEKFLRLRTALFDGVASARFQLGGTLGEPLLRGDATIDEGAVKLPFARFVVQEGRVSLTPEQDIEPQVSFVGTVRRMNYDLRVEVSGGASAPVVVFSSSPPLEAGQVLLLVMAGEAPRAEVTSSDQQRVARLGAYFGQSLMTSLGGESETGQRLTLTSGEAVSRQAKETYGIEYRLSERWSLVGEYDEFDEFNAGVKWRVFSKGGSKETPQQP